jgi:hypothetical protein
MMNWKGCGRQRSWPNLRYYLPGGAVENHEKFVRIAFVRDEIQSQLKKPSIINK